MILTDGDDVWLRRCTLSLTGVTWAEQRDALAALAESGKGDLRAVPSQRDRAGIVADREKFFRSVGIGEKQLASVRSPVPPDPFRWIMLHRLLATEGIEAARVINAHPPMLHYAPESVREKVGNYRQLGIDAARVINAHPKALSYAPESVREKVDNYRQLGIDAARVINTFPQALGYAPESVREKVGNYRQLGIDAARVINAFPTALGYAPESVREKVRYLRALGHHLKWQGDVTELVHKAPFLLGMNKDKMRLLAHIAARYFPASTSSASIGELLPSLSIPAESYVVTASKDVPSEHFVSAAKDNHRKMPRVRRVTEATDVAAHPGGGHFRRIATLYQEYRQLQASSFGVNPLPT